MSTRFFPSSFVSVGVVSVISLASVGLAGAPVNAQASLNEYDVTAPTLGYGDTGEAVADVQNFLQNQGYNPGEVDGVYGSRTGAAVSEFQEDQGLFRDGIVGRQTWDAMLGSESATENEVVEEESTFEVETEDELVEEESTFDSETDPELGVE
jgi:hypothetical protein